MQLAQPTAEHANESPDASVPVEIALPIIRQHSQRGRFRKSKLVLGIWPGQIVAGVIAPKYDIPSFEFGTSPSDLVKAVKWRRLAYDGSGDTITQIDCKASFGTVYFVLRQQNGKKFSFDIPALEAEPVVRMLLDRFGARIPNGAKVLEKLRGRDDVRAKRALRNRTLAAVNRPPFSSRPLGQLLKVIGTATMIAGLVVLYLSTQAPSGDSNLGFDTFLTSVSLLIMGNVVFRGGRRIAAPSFAEVRGRDRRPPVVFLRSFDSEDVETPAPGLTNLEQSASRAFHEIPFAGFALDALLFVFHFVYSLRGTYAERVEEQISLAVKNLGPVVAVGRPGERIASPGAARAYVSDDQWQDFVLNVIDEAALVLIQVESTAGTWWEFERCIERVRPERLIVMLTAHYGSARAYETLRSRAASLLPRPLPINVGDAAFLRFDADWHATPFPLIYRARFLRALWPSIVDYRRSLAPALRARV